MFNNQVPTNPVQKYENVVLKYETDNVRVTVYRDGVFGGKVSKFICSLQFSGGKAIFWGFGETIVEAIQDAREFYRGNIGTYFETPTFAAHMRYIPETREILVVIPHNKNNRFHGSFTVSFNSIDDYYYVQSRCNALSADISSFAGQRGISHWHLYFDNKGIEKHFSVTPKMYHAFTTTQYGNTKADIGEIIRFIRKNQGRLDGIGSLHIDSERERIERENERMKECRIALSELNAAFQKNDFTNLTQSHINSVLSTVKSELQKRGYSVR